MQLQRFLLILALSVSMLSSARAINIQLDQLHEFKLPNPISLAGKTFGTALAIFGDIAVVAATSEEGEEPGVVYLYANQENWHLINTFSSEQQGDNFAKHIKLVGDMLVVSADKDASHGRDSGAVYIYERLAVSGVSWWQQTAKLTAPDAQAGARFGAGIALVDDILYIGAPRQGQGKVYLYARDINTGQWQVTANIEPEDPQAMRFGADIAQDGQTLIIGAPHTDADNSLLPNMKQVARFQISRNDTFDPGIESGAIFVYKKVADSWQATVRLGSENRETSDNLGEQIAIDGDIIVASVKHKDVLDDLRAGAVYIYQKVNKTWQEDTVLVAPDNNVGATFGNNISVLDQHIFVGANKVQANGFNSGSAYLFARDVVSNAWTSVLQQTNANLQPHDQFGLSVALGAEQMLVASKEAVYIFQNTPVQLAAAVYYPRDNILQLNAVTVANLGIIGLTLQLTQQNDMAALSLLDGYLGADSHAGTAIFTANTGQLSIPELTIHNQEGVSYQLNLQIMEQADPLQFRVQLIKANGI
ncbi:MAG: hypothetical protein methR_P3041 [Methyloprofundus sp.]|nr:MAG: hypothetical protein methR_P3041 [Methyloprofundus sp.]